MFTKRDALYAKTAEPQGADKTTGFMRLKQSYISLDNIRFHANHGVLEQERLTGGGFTVSVRVGCDIAGAVKTDDVCDTLDYSALYEVVKSEMQKPSRLIEHVAGRMAESIFNAFPKAESVDVKITKTNPPMGGNMDGASVELHLVR